MRSARGQGTVEYLAVVLVLVLVFGGTASVASGAGRDIASAVPREVIRALCIVRGGDCYRDRAPCDVALTSNSSSWAVTIAVLKVGHDKTVTITRRSDRTYAVMLDTAPVGGVETTLGARGKVSLGKRSFSLGAALTGGVTGSVAHTKTWIVPTREAALRLVADIEKHAPLRTPDVEGHEGKVEAGVDGTSGLLAGLSGGAHAAVGGGWQSDHKTGNRTYFFAGSVGAEATASVPGTKASGSAEGSDGDRYALTVGPEGRWLDLAVTRTGTLSGKADLPRKLASIADSLDVPAAGGRRWVTESHLDLTDAENLAAAKAFVARLKDPRHPGGLAAALAALSRRIEDNAVVDARTYAVDRDARGAEGHTGAELSVGGKYEKSTENTRLIAATTRGIDGEWSDREDCLQEART